MAIVVIIKSITYIYSGHSYVLLAVDIISVNMFSESGQHCSGTLNF